MSEVPTDADIEAAFAQFAPVPRRMRMTRPLPRLAKLPETIRPMTIWEKGHFLSSTAISRDCLYRGIA